MTKQELIITLKKIDNISKYFAKGGVSKFNKEHNGLLEFINIHTKNIQVFANNKTLTAKLIFLTKYNGDLNQILDNNMKIMIFDNKLLIFKLANINSAKKQWDLCKNNLNTITNYYTKEETINLLKEIYTNFYGKSGNRKLIKYDEKLYMSVLKHTEFLNNLNKNYNKLSMRLYILVNNIETVCPIHNKQKTWTFVNNKLDIICSMCNPKYPSQEWFKKKYGDESKIHIKNRQDKLKNIKTNSLDWYINKYGKIKGIEEYSKSVEYKVNQIVTLKGNRYSKISQELFWNVYNRLENKSNVYFFELNQEYVIKIPPTLNYNKTIMIVDFIQNNKIVEYNGDYWHNIVDDNIRKDILQKMGYDVLYISSSEYNKNKKDVKIINKILNHLTC